ncbi:pericentriolar material 1 protein isoform X2 [Engraulis encrasicolus]|uniref:pericentriolar material 1 protein isoform X2 n=1 Tax=Engraulis encrasicolus TaxID=184585 RepID=UPI002FD247D6
MATGGASFDDCTDEQELHNWTVANGSLDDRLNNMDWGVQQKKANRSSEKNRKKFSAVSESRLTNDISPESTPGAGRRRARTQQSLSHVKYTTQMSVPDQAELERLRQRINFTDLDERSIGSDSQGRVTAANNQRQLAENKKPFNFLPLHVNTNKSKELPGAAATSSASASTPGAREPKKQSPGKDLFLPVSVAVRAPERGEPLELGQVEPTIESSQVVSKLVQIRESISKANAMRDDMLEKNDVPANVERLSHLIARLKEQEKAYLRFLQKMLAREEEEEEDRGTVDSAVGSGSVAESTSLNIEPCSETSDTTGRGVRGEQKEELENLRKQHELLKKMLEQQEQLRALQGRQAALLAMQQSAEQAMHVMDDSVVTETTGSVSGISITSELNDELNDLIQRFHNQLHDTQTKAVVPDNRRQAESLSLSREVCRSRDPQQQQQSSSLLLPPAAPLPPGGGAVAGPSTSSAAASSLKLSKLQELQDKKETMDKILQELHSLRDQTLNNRACQGVPQSLQRGFAAGVSSERPSVLGREASGACVPQQDSYLPMASHPADRLRKLKEVHKRLNELRELVRYYEQTSDMMVDAVNENVKDDDDDDEETEDGSLFEAVFDSEQENRDPITTIRNPRHASNWMDMNSLTNGRGPRGSNNQGGRLNTDCEINNRSATNLRSLNIPSIIECQYNRDGHFGVEKDENEDEDEVMQEEGARRGARDRDSDDGSGSSRRSSLVVADDDTEFTQKVHRLQTAKQKLRQLRELVAMVQSDDTDGTTANEDDCIHQQPNNTRAAAPKAKRALALSDKAREKLYEEKLLQQQQELKQLQDERQRLMDIQGKIQDLQRACPDLQSSVSSSVTVPGVRMLPAAPSAPACGPSPSTSSALLKPAAEMDSPTPENELWTEMRRHQIMREELRQRRKHLQSLMAEQQRRSMLTDATCRSDATLNGHLSHAASRDERTMATWGGSPPCRFEDDSFSSETEGEEEGDSGGEDSSYTDDMLHVYPKKQPFSGKKSRNSGLKSPECYPGDSSQSKQQQQQQHQLQQQQQQGASGSRGRRQENLRWAADLSLSEGMCYWQEQVSQLQRQLDLSTSMCQTLLQDQQTLSCMLQTVMTGPHGLMPGSMASPQVPLIMHQLNQCYTQLAWQQSNIQRLKQSLNELLRKQQQEQKQQPLQQQQTGQQKTPGQPTPAQDSPAAFLPFALNMPGLAPCSPVHFSMTPLFNATGNDFPQNSTAQAGPFTQLPDPNLSMKTEYMSFPPPLQRATFNNTDNRPQMQPDSSVTDPQSPGWLTSSHVPEQQLQQQQQHSPASASHLPPPPPPQQLQQSSYSPSSSPVAPKLLRGGRCYQQQDSQESLSSMPDPGDPTTVTRTYRAGRKASAQASLASRDKTPNAKSRRRRGKGKHAGVGSDSVSSTADYFHGSVRSKVPQAQPRGGPNQSLLDKLTQEKLDNKAKSSKAYDVSSAYAWRTPFLSNRIACTEAPDASSDFSLFEALKETIYSEVATLISQNNSRPHFLIELFHELQLLNTDYLRQRALYSLQDIVTRHLTEKNVADDQASSLGPAAWVGGSQSELTPSESLATSDTEMSEKNLVLKQKLVMDGDFGDEDSIMSSSSTCDPFASDDQGNTVLRLDRARARIREYERTKLQAQPNFSNKNSLACVASNADLPSGAADAAAATAAGLLEVLCGGSQQGSGDRRPQIDTFQLERQIKAIMSEVITFLKEHLEEVCSHQLLASVRRMVLTLTHQNEESREFVRFFHRQLSGILQDSLGKFLGQSLQDCGEDLLVDISEILFNELAFFSLIQDLDNNRNGATKKRPKGNSNTTSNNKHTKKTEGKGAEAETALLPAFRDQDKDRDETEQEGASRNAEQEQHLQQQDGQSSESSEVEEEEEEEGEDEKEDDEEHDQEGPRLSINLSKAETQPLTNYGSGEDENELEEEEEFEAGPVEVQTSLQANTDTTHDHKQCNGVTQLGISLTNGTSQDQETAEGQEAMSTGSAVQSMEVLDSQEGEEDSVSAGHQAAAEPEGQEEAERSEVASAPVNGQGGTQGSSSGSPDTESPVMINVDEVGSGNTSQKSDEDDFVKVEDLPLQLSVMSEEELRKRITEEQRNNNLTTELLNGNTEGLASLIGDGMALREPEPAVIQSV